jgi:hypothetical protein
MITLYLKSIPSYTISSSISRWFWESTDEQESYLAMLIRDNKNSLIIKHDEEVIKWSTADNKINKRYENTESLLNFDDLDYTFSWDDVYVTANEADFYQTESSTPYIPTSSYTLTIGDPTVKSDKMKCTSCGDTGIIDSYMYGQYECTVCSNTTEKKEEELSAWDKKLKEELDNGDDTWGSISKKYK